MLQVAVQEGKEMITSTDPRKSTSHMPYVFYGRLDVNTGQEPWVIVSTTRPAGASEEEALCQLLELLDADQVFPS